MLRSAVGMAHVLRSRLLMDYATSYFPLIVLGSYGPLPDTLCPGALLFPPLGSRGQFGPIRGLVTFIKSTANKDRLLPVPTYGSTWVVLWLLFSRSAPSTFPKKQSTLKGPFQGVPSR